MVVKGERVRWRVERVCVCVCGLVPFMPQEGPQEFLTMRASVVYPTVTTRMCVCVCMSVRVCACAYVSVCVCVSVFGSF